MTGSFEVYDRPRLSLRRLHRGRRRTGRPSSRRARTGARSSARCCDGQVAAAEELRDRVSLDDAEQEEVEETTNSERRECAQDLPGDEPEAHAARVPASARARLPSPSPLGRHSLLPLVRATTTEKRSRRSRRYDDRSDDPDDHPRRDATAVAGRSDRCQQDRVRGRRVREQHRPDARGLSHVAGEAIGAIGLEVRVVRDDVVDRGVVASRAASGGRSRPASAGRARRSAPCSRRRSSSCTSSRRCSSSSDSRDPCSAGCTGSSESFGSGSTNGVQPHSNRSYSPLPMISVSLRARSTVLIVVPIPISLSQPVTNSRRAGGRRTRSGRRSVSLTVSSPPASRGCRRRSCPCSRRRRGSAFAFSRSKSSALLAGISGIHFGFGEGSSSCRPCRARGRPCRPASACRSRARSPARTFGSESAGWPFFSPWPPLTAISVKPPWSPWTTTMSGVASRSLTESAGIVVRGVDLALLERRDHRVGVVEEPEDDLVDLRLAAPVARVGLHPPELAALRAPSSVNGPEPTPSSAVYLVMRGLVVLLPDVLREDVRVHRRKLRIGTELVITTVRASVTVAVRFATVEAVVEPLLRHASG